MNTATGAAPRFDFPTWLPPMLVKELRQGLRTRGFVLSLVALHAIMVFGFVWALVINVFHQRDALSMANGFFWVFAGMLLGVITPLRALGGLGGEIRARNVDLLMLTQLTSWRVVLGKWISLVTQAALVVVTLLPYGVARYFLGSVDLLQDFNTLAWLFALSCTATALMLWFSSLGKVLRVVLVIGIVLFGNAFFGSTIFSLIFYGAGRGGWFMRGGGMFSSGVPVCAQALVLFNLAILLAFFLLQAVRRIAPPSENHSALTRVFAFATLAPLPLLALPGVPSARDMLEMQTVFALVAFMLVCVLELTSMSLPMGVHVRAFSQKGRAAAFFSRFFLPGWQSAALFTAAGLAVFAGLTLCGAFPDPLAKLRFLRVLGLLWVAVTLPSAVVSLFLKPGTNALASMIVYGAAQVLLGMLCLFGAFFINEMRSVDTLDDVVMTFFRAVPVINFWFELGLMAKRSVPADAGLLVVQIAGAGLCTLFIWWRARGYWRHVDACKTAK